MTIDLGPTEHFSNVRVFDRAIRSRRRLVGPILLMAAWTPIVVTVNTILASGRQFPVPQVEGLGLQYAVNTVLKSEGFTTVQTVDASKAQRPIVDPSAWKVCGVTVLNSSGEYVVVSRARRDSVLRLAATPIDETCGRDTTLPQQALSFPMPNFRGFTPSEVVKVMRATSSLRFFSHLDGSQIPTREYSDWRVCSQQLEVGATFYGQPIAFTAVPFEKASGDPAAPANLGAACPDRGWQGVLGRPTAQFPALVNPS